MGLFEMISKSPTIYWWDYLRRFLHVMGPFQIYTKLYDSLCKKTTSMGLFEKLSQFLDTFEIKKYS